MTIFQDDFVVETFFKSYLMKSFFFATVKVPWNLLTPDHTKIVFRFLFDISRKNQVTCCSLSKKLL